MDPINPIVPRSVQPAPVGPVPRVAPPGKNRERELAERRPRPSPPSGEAPAADGVTPDGHLDARV